MCSGPVIAVAHQRVQRLAGDLLQDQLQAEHVEVGVQVRGAGRVDRLGVEDGLLPRGDVGVALPQRGDRVGVEPRGVGEEFLDGDVALAVGGELRDVVRHGRVEVDPPGLELLHGHDRGEQLRQRGQVVDGVGTRRDPLALRQLVRWCRRTSPRSRPRRGRPPRRRAPSAWWHPGRGSRRRRSGPPSRPSAARRRRWAPRRAPRRAGCPGAARWPAGAKPVYGRSNRPTVRRACGRRGAPPARGRASERVREVSSATAAVSAGIRMGASSVGAVAGSGGRRWRVDPRRRSPVLIGIGKLLTTACPVNHCGPIGSSPGLRFPVRGRAHGVRRPRGAPGGRSALGALRHHVHEGGAAGHDVLAVAGRCRCCPRTSPRPRSTRCGAGTRCRCPRCSGRGPCTAGRPAGGRPASPSRTSPCWGTAAG